MASIAVQYVERAWCHCAATPCALDLSLPPYPPSRSDGCDHMELQCSAREAAVWPARMQGRRRDSEAVSGVGRSPHGAHQPTRSGAGYAAIVRLNSKTASVPSTQTMGTSDTALATDDGGGSGWCAASRRKRLLPECEQVGLGEGAECGGIREAAVEVECALR
eukprot:CAMPEP_0181254742 /NCGR_PEP_ID=MMETSP1096-20121128/48772_1 /TAXON_ID=156174 ORGANISM="Chrysochromulina ericina, Strain CCMP281" /NCGR_SAMPLE_ID=MMETSP1096 /ASSEMBLY_ACC=CAM_ASM_000453 /LENGTH=162 /DNA_ID=CAMNT_0023352811 /DNA_START=151 /DNA_END=637 /DNA_ORIENTATION=-